MFVEVCLGKQAQMTGPGSTGVDGAKRKVLAKLARLYMTLLPAGTETRFDVLFVNLNPMQEQNAQGRLKTKRSAPEFIYVRGAF